VSAVRQILFGLTLQAGYDSSGYVMQSPGPTRLQKHLLDKAEPTCIVP
jgi:hypothetical protein